MLGEGVIVGYKVMFYGCEIGDYFLIGINVVVLNGVKIGKYCIIGVNVLIMENMEILDYSLVVGVFGKVIRIFDEKIEFKLKVFVEYYVDNVKIYKLLL